MSEREVADLSCELLQKRPVLCLELNQSNHEPTTTLQHVGKKIIVAGNHVAIVTTCLPVLPSQCGNTNLHA